MSPIKPENLARYPADWPEIRARIQLRAKNRCECCGVKNWAIGGRNADGIFVPAYPIAFENSVPKLPALGTSGWCGTDGPTVFLRIFRIVCTVAHLDHTPENCADENLRFLCQRCHLAHDKKHHAESAYATRRAGKAIEMFEGQA